MPGKPTSGNRSGARGKPTRVRRTLTKAAAERLEAELAWASHEMQDAILSQLALLAPLALLDQAVAATKDDGTPIIL